MSNGAEVPANDVKRLPLADRKILAKEDYFKYTSITDVARKYDIKLPTVKSWVYGQKGSNKVKGWKSERELAKNQLLKDLSKDKRGMVYNMVDGALFLLYDYVDKKKKEVIQSGIPINVKDADKITNMLMNLSKIVEGEKKIAQMMLTLQLLQMLKNFKQELLKLTHLLQEMMKMKILLVMMILLPLNSFALDKSSYALGCYDILTEFAKSSRKVKKIKLPYNSAYYFCV